MSCKSPPASQPALPKGSKFTGLSSTPSWSLDFELSSCSPLLSMATTRQSEDSSSTPTSSPFPSASSSFLAPLSISTSKIHSLARSLCSTFTSLAANSQEQFLPTPISDSVLRPEGDESGRYLAIDIGGTNLRVGFIELLGSDETSSETTAKGEDAVERSRVQRHLEKSWPIGEQLKHNKAEDLFAWIGKCIAEVVQDGSLAWPGDLPHEIPLGITFSFPMIQHTLSEATLMSMGKGFQITSNLDLGRLLLEGYEKSRDLSLPRIKITAIVNDAVATLVSFAYQYRSNARRKAAMGLIVGTGCNATIPLALSKLHPKKRPAKVKVLDGETEDGDQNLKIAVNTEWTIRGAADPLHELDFITRWDEKLDAECDAPGFQPFEYMTAGRYLGELGRIIILEYLTRTLSIPESTLPPLLTQRHGLTTTFLGNLGPHLAATEPSLLKQLEIGIPPSTEGDAWQWTAEVAEMVYDIAKAIQVRAAGMTAAAVIALLACAEEIHISSATTTTQHLPNGTFATTSESASEPALINGTKEAIDELMVGYTGGCIVHFQDYLADCQGFLDEIMEVEFGRRDDVPRVVLMPCHDGGIIGAGILAGTVQSLAHDG
ncbi:hexokinase family protein-like protein [Rhexocercosporidium sp. MPI-PUGE-AT-0058]|nr:hexokinase family protein-like protein [Rhexocercosporidium sp. MPI-PUGE-AT-0058]